MIILNKTLSNFLTILLLFTFPVIAYGDAVSDITKKAAEAAFTEAERQAIQKYYELTAPMRDKEDKTSQDEEDNDRAKRGDNKKDKGGNKSREKKGAKELPKGIVKKLERGGTLPPGMEKRGLPDDLNKQLTPPPKGYERTVSGEQVVLSDIATGVITDIINIGKNSVTDKSRRKEDTNSGSSRSEDEMEKQLPEKAEKKWWQFWKD